MTPQEQAEAIVDQWESDGTLTILATNEKQGLVDRISKLIAENEMIKKSCEMWANDYADAQSQLTATEAKFRDIKELVCGGKSPRWVDDWNTTHTRGMIADICDSVLSTLTAEKKDTCSNCGKHKYEHAGGGYCPNPLKNLGDSQNHYDYSQTFSTAEKKEQG